MKAQTSQFSFYSFDVLFASSVSSSIALIAAADSAGYVTWGGQGQWRGRGPGGACAAQVGTGLGTLKGEMEHEICHREGSQEP